LKIEFINKLARAVPERVFMSSRIFLPQSFVSFDESGDSVVQMEGESADTLILNLSMTYFIIIIRSVTALLRSGFSYAPLHGPRDHQG